MAANVDADAYANDRIGIYFPGQPASLTGQCVSLAKWFLGEMCGIGNWQAARGHAKDFGDTLVAQGLATIVPTSQRGDLAVWKKDGGGYGHIGVVLSGSRVFEENVGLAGTPSEVFGGNTVFASRIDPLVASWRKGSPIFYRVKSYVENQVQPSPPKGGEMVTNQDQLNRLYDAVLHRARGAGEGEDVYLGKDSGWVFNDLYIAGERASQLRQEADEKAALISQRDQANAKSVGLVASVSDLTARLDIANKEFDALREQLADTSTIKAAEARAKALQSLLDAANEKISELEAADKPEPTLPVVPAAPPQDNTSQKTPLHINTDTLKQLLGSISQWLVSLLKKK